MTDCDIPPLKINRSSVTRYNVNANNNDVEPLLTTPPPQKKINVKQS